MGQEFSDLQTTVGTDVLIFNSDKAYVRASKIEKVDEPSQMISVDSVIYSYVTRGKEGAWRTIDGEQFYMQLGHSYDAAVKDGLFSKWHADPRLKLGMPDGVEYVEPPQQDLPKPDDETKHKHHCFCGECPTDGASEQTDRPRTTGPGFSFASSGGSLGMTLLARMLASRLAQEGESEADAPVSADELAPTTTAPAPTPTDPALQAADESTPTTTEPAPTTTAPDDA